MTVHEAKDVAVPCHFRRTRLGYMYCALSWHMQSQLSESTSYASQYHHRPAHPLGHTLLRPQMKLAVPLHKERIWVMMDESFTPQKEKENRPPADVLIHIQQSLWYPAWDSSQVCPG